MARDDTPAGAEDRADLPLDQRLARLSPVHRALLDQRLQEEPASGHSLVARTLAGLGITHVYGVPGQPVYDTFAACARENIRVISAHHQHPAALMATAHNYFAGQQKAASIVSTGVPAASALSAVAVARDNCWPLVILAGAVPRAAGESGYFMALDSTELYRPVTKWAARVPETHAIPALIAKAFVKMDPYEVWGSGNQDRNFTYVSDVVRGMMLACEKIRDARPVNIGSSEHLRIRDVVELIFALTGFRPRNIHYDLSKPVGVRSRAADLSLARKLLGWEPQVSFAEGLLRSIDWYYSTHDVESVRRTLPVLLTERSAT